MRLISRLKVYRSVSSRKNVARVFVMHLIIVMAISLVLQACGFRLRGNIDLPPEFDTIYIDDISESSQITPALIAVMKRNDISITKNVSSAKVIIVINGEKYQRQILTVSSGGNVEEYELSYLVNFGIRQFAGEDKPVTELLKDQLVNLKRDLRFDENAVLAKSTEEQELRESMLRIAAEQIIRRLYKLQDIKAAAASEAKASDNKGADSKETEARDTETKDTENNKTNTDSTDSKDIKS